MDSGGCARDGRPLPTGNAATVEQPIDPGVSLPIPVGALPPLLMGSQAGQPTGDAPAFCTSGAASTVSPTPTRNALEGSLTGHVFEIFCGTARLSDACLHEGLRATPIDWRGVRAVPAAPVTFLDLTDGAQQAQCLAMLGDPCHSPAFCWLATPCGTLSKARERPIPVALQRRGVPKVVPLRSVAHLWGLPEALACPRQGPRVRSANKLIAFTFDCIDLCTRLEIPWAIENPASSLLWAFPNWAAILLSPGVHDVLYDACMHGADRPKAQRIRCNSPALDHLAGACDGTHQHAPWGLRFSNGRFASFATSELTAYPQLFCARVGQALAALLPSAASVAAGSAVTTRREPSSASCLPPSAAQRRAAAGAQPRGAALPPVVPEYGSILSVRATWSQAAPFLSDHRRHLPHARRVGAVDIPAHAQLINGRDLLAGGEVVSDPDKLYTLSFGIAWKPTDFLARALDAVHPFHYPANDPAAAFAFTSILVYGKDFITQARSDFIKFWKARGEALRPVDEAFCAGLHPDVANKARVKRPHLFCEMLQATGFHQDAISACWSFLVQGVPIVGPLPNSKAMPQKSRPALRSADEVLKSGRWSTRVLCASMGPGASRDVDEAVYSRTLDELARGECKGPFTMADLDAMFPSGWVGARRFGVAQKGDVRPVDDFSLCGQNDSSDTPESIDAGGVDAIVAVARGWTEAVSGSSVSLAGLEQEGSAALHPTLRSLSSRALVGRVVDLAKAYKQVPADPRTAPWSPTAVWNPRQERGEFFIPTVLPFGARNSVFGFYLLAVALQWIAGYGLYVPVVNFFDDFTQVEATATAASGAAALLGLFRLLGWSYKDGPEHLRPLASCFTALGVSIDFQADLGRSIEVGITPARALRLQEELEALESCGGAMPAQLSSLAGKLQFADCVCLGRCGRFGLAGIRKLASRGNHVPWSALAEPVLFWRRYLARSRPRLIRLSPVFPPVVILCDAAAERLAVGLSGVCVDRVTGTMQVWAWSPPVEVVEAWLVPDQQLVIAQAELVAVAISLATWADLLTDRECLVFSDNDAARHAIIRGASSHSVSSRIADWIRLHTVDARCGLWLERVASPANIADAPSRGSCELLVGAGFTVVDHVVPDAVLYARSR